jgi:hypothetical protein
MRRRKETDRHGSKKWLFGQNWCRPREMYFPHLSIAIFTFFAAFITQMSAVFMSIHWASDPFMIFDHPFPFKIAFGIAIPLAIASLVLFALLLLDSQSRFYSWSLLILVIFETAVPLGLTSPRSLKSWVATWNAKWSNTSHPMAFQYEKSCCGWENYQDRAILDCHFLSMSGCRRLVDVWISTRYDEIFLIYWFIAVCYGYTMVTILCAIHSQHIECIWAEIEIPFLSSSLYRG